jgi:ATPase family associated with various cellular activities (AAA)
MKVQQLITQGLSLPLNAISYHVSQELAGLYPQKIFLETHESSFNVEAFANAKLCTIEYDSSTHNQIVTGWSGMNDSVYKYIENGCFTITWEEHQFGVLMMRWQEGYCKETYYWLLGDNLKVLENFLITVCEWNTEIRGEILVFEGGYWYKDEELFKSIQNASFDNLILGGTLKQDIQNDITHFLGAKETYDTYSIPWKRGILFIGSPGNGKTHAVKALINKLQVPCLYVKSLKSQYDNPHQSIQEVFKRARQTTPCLLVLEDLDSLIEGENRSFFLNELDGFAANTGIVILATTNFPEKIDPAILNRPSRFDRKYYFSLPELPERLAYIKMWNDRLKESTALSDAGMSQAAEMTEGFSFAYMKELFLSSMMHWMGTQESGAMDKSVISQIDVLKQQMQTDTQS